MPDLDITEYSSYDAFAQQWDDYNEQDTRVLWQLLSLLDDDELLIQLPQWLADEKVGFVESSTPTEFVGRIEDETEKAILFMDSASARPLMKLAHRIQTLERGVENAGDDDGRREWLEDRLREKHQEFENREDVVGLQDEWLPKSQILHAIQQSD